MNSLFFEDFTVGTTFGPSCPRVLTQREINDFADRTGDRNLLHIDPEFAAKGPWGRTVAHGMLVASIASGEAWQIGLRDAQAVLKGSAWSFFRPVFADDLVTVEVKVESTTQARKGPGGDVTFSAVVKNHHGKKVAAGTWDVWISSRPQVPATSEQPVHAGTTA